MKQLLVTGGAGFIGSNFIRRLLARDDGCLVVNLDKLTYAGNPENLRDLERNPRYRFLKGDVADRQTVRQALEGCEAVVHFAAETHVDRSITGADAFLRTNVLGTQCLLEESRAAGVCRFVHISTDEVYGSLEQGEADEDSPMRPNSPYSASKAAADHLCRAHHVTYGLPVVILRACNNYGPFQFPEKFLPLLITNALTEIPLPVYGDGLYTREWLYVEDFCEAIEIVLAKGKEGEAYNVGTAERQVNLEVAREICRRLGKHDRLIQHVTDRPGHDRRYAIVSEKIRTLGWRPRHSFPQGLQQTIQWYRDNPAWWRSLKEKASPARSASTVSGA
jgi:dTDP-glucose 4,6-dehydratase